MASDSKSNEGIVRNDTLTSESVSTDAGGPAHAPPFGVEVTGEGGDEVPTADEALPGINPGEGLEVATEVKEPPPPNITELCKDTFNKTAVYLNGELAGTAADYEFLEKMNRATITKYTEMKHISTNIAKAMHDLNSKYKSLQPYLDQIDLIEENVASLEQAAYKLDAYSKRLDARFKQLQSK